MRARRLILVAIAVGLVAVGLGVPAFVHFRFDSSITVTTNTAPAPAPFGEVDPTDALQAGGALGKEPIVDHRLLADQGVVILVRRPERRRWSIGAAEAKTGRDRWRYGRDNVNHIEAWTMADGVVVACFHRTSSRLARRIGRWVSLVGLDPVSGKQLWKRSDLFMPPNGKPGLFHPGLAEDALVYARTAGGRWQAVKARTGQDDPAARQLPPGRR